MDIEKVGGYTFALLGLVIVYACLAWRRNLVWQDPVELWNDAVSKDSTSMRARFFRGLAYQAGGRHRKAIEDFSAALDGGVKHIERVHAAWGISLEKLDTPDQALKHYTAAINADQSFALPYRKRGAMLLKENRIDAALRDFDRALDLEPTAGTWINRGTIFETRGNYSEAITCYEKALKLNPESGGGDAYFNRGNCHLQLGKLTQAAKDYTAALRLNPERADVYANRGAVFLQAGEFALAVDDFGRALERDPSLTGVYLNRAFAYHYLGEFEKARADAAVCSEQGRDISEFTKLENGE